MFEQRATGPRLTVVVTALDEASRVQFVLRQLPDADQVVLVDGGSTDGTPQAAVQARPDVEVLLRPALSRAAAVAEGLAHADGELIIVLPLDGVTDPDVVTDLVAGLLAGAGAVKGTRYAGDDRPPLGERVLSWLGRRVHGTGLSDLGHGCYGFWADQRVLLSLPRVERGPWTSDVDITIACQLARAGARIVEVPVPAGGAATARTSLRSGVRAVLAERRRARAGAVRSGRAVALVDAARH